MIRSLTPREQVILRLYFYEEMSLGQVGKSIGLSAERTRQVMQRACRKLRETQPAQRLFPVLVS
jgi:RNA polymerase sigma factor for flagellar operon FliA